MTDDGARSIALVDPPLPATWLCAFDPSVRYARPTKLDSLKEEFSPGRPVQTLRP